MRSLFTFYNPWRIATTLTYMLQNVEYQAVSYLRWFWRTQDFSKVLYRRTLNTTKIARLLRFFMVFGMSAQIVVGIHYVLAWQQGRATGGLEFGSALLLSYPVVWSHLAVVPLVAGRIFVTGPRERRAIAASAEIFKNHSGSIIAVAGSYGKSSMKELLVTVLSEGKNVAATPANKNVASSHAQFAKSLTGDEAILVLEYGEGKPGDVAGFAKTTHPTHGIITGLAPAHLDRYKTLQAAGQDIFALASYLRGKQVYVNADSAATKSFLKKTYETYSLEGALGWKAQKIKVDFGGTSFELSKGSKTLRLHSKLLGKHQVGPLSLVAALGLELGLNAAQVERGVAQTVPYEHRMQPYKLGGAWVLDDTYNGNIEGIRAGTALLKELSAKRKLYVTPGLVDQGSETEAVHIEMGALIAAAQPDVVILMQNSVTKHIQAGLEKANFSGEIRLESDPLSFYTSLEHQLAAGDVVLMQNDWTDNYA